MPPPTGDDLEEADLETMSEICSDIYGDGFCAASEWYVGRALVLPKERCDKRGRQIAVVLKRMGWTDDEILCYLGLAVGVATDLGTLKRAKDQEEALKVQDEKEPAPKPPRAPRAARAPRSDPAPPPGAGFEVQDDDAGEDQDLEEKS